MHDAHAPPLRTYVQSLGFAKPKQPGGMETLTANQCFLHKTVGCLWERLTCSSASSSVVTIPHSMASSATLTLVGSDTAFATRPACKRTCKLGFREGFNPGRKGQLTGHVHKVNLRSLRVSGSMTISL